MTSAAPVRTAPGQTGPARSETGPRRFFAAPDTDERHRRPADIGMFALATAGVVLLASRAGRDGSFETTLTRALAEAPAWLRDLVAGVYKLASVTTAAVLVGGALVTRRWRLARDLALAGALAWMAGWLVAGVAAGSFPLVRVAVVTALLVTASPFLTRPARRVGWSVIALTGAAAALVPAGFPADVLGGFLLGVAVGAGLHLVFGSPSGRPSLAQVVRALAELGITAGSPVR